MISSHLYVQLLGRLTLVHLALNSMFHFYLIMLTVKESVQFKALFGGVLFNNRYFEISAMVMVKKITLAADTLQFFLCLWSN